MSNKLRLVLLIIGLLITVSFLSVFAAVYVLQATHREAIVPGVRVEGIDVGGLDCRQALNLVRQHLPQPSPDSVLTLLCPEGYTRKINYGDLHYTHNYEATINRALQIGKQLEGLAGWRVLFKIAYTGTELELETNFSRNALRTILEQIKTEFSSPPEDSRIAYDGEKVALLPGAPGRELDIQATMEHVEQTRLRQHRILLVFREIEPELSLDSLKYLNTRFGFYLTTFDPADRGRTHNIQLASELLNNQIVDPEEIFSLNQALGPRTPENNYVLALVFAGGRIVPGYGGGICQVASTLYNAVLDAELPVIERHGHSQPVPYVPPGRDATLVGNILDFKFQNNRRYPLLLSSRVEKDKLMVSIYGHASDAQNIVYQPKTERKTIPHQTVFRVDQTLKSGEIKVLVPGRDGYEVTTYQVATVNNEVIQREILSQKRVKPQTAVILVAPADKSHYGIDK